MAVVRPYRGVSAEDRRADRRDRLLDAGLDVLGSEGVAGTTMKAVCARAGLTERYFYESFKDLDELLLAVMDACMWAIDDAVEAASAAAPNDLLERSRAATRALIETLTEDPRRARVYVEAVGSDALRERQARGVRAYARRLAELMRECMELPATHKGRLELATLVLVGGTTQVIVSWLDGTLDVSRDALVEEVAQLCVAAGEAVKAS